MDGRRTWIKVGGDSHWYSLHVTLRLGERIFEIELCARRRVGTVPHSASVSMSSSVQRSKWSTVVAPKRAAAAAIPVVKPVRRVHGFEAPSLLLQTKWRSIHRA